MNVWLGEIWRAWRASLRKPGFLCLGVFVLALGVGATASVFTLIDNVVLKPLPFPQASRLVMAGGRSGDSYQASVRILPVLRQLAGVRSLGLFENAQPTNVLADGVAQQASAMSISRGLIPTLGVRMILGRNFSAQEDARGGPAAVMLSRDFWVRQFNADPHVLGRRIDVEGKPRTIVGVLPRDFAPVAATADWQGTGVAMALPLVLPDDPSDPNADNFVYTAVARLAPGVDVHAAGAEFDSRVRAFYANADMGDKGRHMATLQYGMVPLAHGMRAMRGMAHAAQSVPVLLLFLAAAGLVLLIALVNLSSLMKLRAIAHAHARAVRHALGAGMLRQVLPVLAEAFLIGVLGAALGLALAWIGLALLQHALPAHLVGDVDFGLGGEVCLLAFLAGVGGSLLAAVAGMIRVRAEAAMDGLREDGRSGLGRVGLRLGRALVVVQVVLTTVLLSLAGLFLRTLYDAARVPLGFEPAHVATFQLAPVQATYPNPGAIRDLSERVLQRLRAIPGVRSATAATGLPVANYFTTSLFLSPQDTVNVPCLAISPDFFDTFDIHVQRGRVFDRGDMHGTDKVAVVNQAFAQSYLHGRAVGAVVHLGGPQLRVIGVVGDVRQDGPLAPVQPMIFQPLSQVDFAFVYSQLSFAVRVAGDPSAYRSALKAAVAEVAPDQPIFDLRPLRDVVAGTTSLAQLTLLLAGIFATLGLLLSVAGLYVVMAVSVAAREHEFGVRMALGCSPLRLLRLVLRGGLWQIGAGLVVGFAAVVALAHVLRAFLVSMGGRGVLNPIVLVGVGGLFLLAGLLACLLPALRAARVPPMRALRGE
ncbi:MAG TPA: ABC transporter permease [Rhodanobacter sp.]|nr:ABC transporter permease [Rhodanobacter sp.]